MTHVNKKKCLHVDFFFANEKLVKYALQSKAPCVFSLVNFCSGSSASLHFSVFLHKYDLKRSDFDVLFM